MSDFHTIAIYTRVSIEDQDLKTNNLKIESNSLSNQKKLIYAYIESHHDLSGKQIIEYSDDGFTGRNFERPGFERMMKAVKEGHINCVITKDCSRFGRDYIEVGDYIEHIFPFLSVRFIAINDGYDSVKSNGTTPGLDFAFKNLIYDLYSQDLSQKVTSAIHTKMKNGKYVSAFGLYGYKKSPDRAVPLVIDEEAAEIIRLIFQLAIDGNSTQNIAKVLNGKRIMTPSVYRKSKGQIHFWLPERKTPIWSTATIVRILRDERYMGNMVYYKRVKNGHGKNTKLNEKDKQIRVENTHEPIISKEKFLIASESLKKQSARKGKRKKASVFFCPHCGHRLRESRSNEKYYYCYSGRMNAKDECKKVLINKEQIDRVVIELIKTRINIFVDFQKKALKSNVKHDTKKIDSINREIRKLEQINIELYQQFREGIYSKEKFISKKEKHLLIINKLKEQLSELKKGHEDNYQRGINTEKTIDIIKPYIEFGQYNKNVVSGLINKVVVLEEDRLEVEWAFEYECAD